MLANAVMCLKYQSHRTNVTRNKYKNKNYCKLTGACESMYSPPSLLYSQPPSIHSPSYHMSFLDDTRDFLDILASYNYEEQRAISGFFSTDPFFLLSSPRFHSYISSFFRTLTHSYSIVSLQIEYTPLFLKLSLSNTVYVPWSPRTFLLPLMPCVIPLVNVGPIANISKIFINKYASLLVVVELFHASQLLHVIHYKQTKF